jgi:single-stranded-DNA-specific exonuclease
VGNPEPVLVARRLQVMRFPRVVGRNHLKCKVRQAVAGPVVDGIGFGLGAWLPVLDQADPPRVDVAFVAERNVWNDRETLQLRMKDVKLSEDPDCPPA